MAKAKRPKVVTETYMKNQVTKHLERYHKQSAIWGARWNSIVCPFKRVSDYFSEDFVQERKAILEPLQKAREELNKFRGVKA
jgi:hypothetical protein